FQAEDGIRDPLVTEFRRVLFRSLERAAGVNAASGQGATEVLSILHHVMVTPLQDPRDIYADSTLLRPVVDDDVGPTWLIVVWAHDDLDPCGGGVELPARIEEERGAERGRTAARTRPDRISRGAGGNQQEAGERG